MAGKHSLRKTKKRLRKLPGHSKIQARRPKRRTFKSSTKRKRAANPKQFLFPTKRSAEAYARAHRNPGVRISIRKMKKAKTR